MRSSDIFLALALLLAGTAPAAAQDKPEASNMRLLEIGRASCRERV